MKKRYIKYIILAGVIAGALLGIALFFILRTPKRVTDLSTVGLDTWNSKTATLEERQYSYLMKLTKDLGAPWELDGSKDKFSKADNGNTIFEVVCSSGTYKFEMTPEGIWYKVTKLGKFDQWELDITYAYGGNWVLSGDEYWSTMTLDLATYAPYEVQDITEVPETEIILRPMEINTKVDVSEINRDDMGKEGLLKEEEMWSQAYYLIEHSEAPWFGKDYKKVLINAEDGTPEIMIEVEGVRYRLRTDKGYLYRFYKDSEFTDIDETFLVRATGGVWERADSIDGWYVMSDKAYVK